MTKLSGGPIAKEDVPETQSESIRHLSLHFRVRPVLMRWLVCAISLALTAIVVPHVFFTGSDTVDKVLAWLVVSAVFGLLIAFVKPLVQLLLLPLIFVSFGLVLVVINTIVIWLLTVLFPNWFQVDHILWALMAGLVSGVSGRRVRKRARYHAAHHPGPDGGAEDPLRARQAGPRGG